HGSDIFQPADEFRLPRVLARADAITAVAGPVADRIRAFPNVDPSRVHIIPNGIDIDFWATALSESGRDRERPLIMTTGRLLKVKGHDFLLEAFADLRRQHPAARLLIIGDGEERDALERLADELQVRAHVEFAGYLDRDQV